MYNPLISLIIPVYNRPIEVEELLNTCLNQEYKNFEILIIEDGSTKKCKSVADKFSASLHIRYFEIKNCGQGFAKNYGFENATGDFWITLDSDVLLPTAYLSHIVGYLGQHKNIDAFGGPDNDHPSFSLIQRAISFSLTSYITTGGIRGSKKSVSTYHPRSFNMGITPKVFEITKGYRLPFKGEDIDFSIRIIDAGLNIGFIEDAFVYHKRRTSWQHFFRQMRFFGSARSELQRTYHKQAGGVIYALPSIFLIFSCLIFGMTALSFLDFRFLLSLVPLGIFTFILFMEALYKTKSILVAFMAPLASFIQLWGYGLGFLEDKIMKRSPVKHHSPEKK